MLTVGASDIMVTVLLGIAVVALVVVAHKELVLTAFDRDGATAMGYGRSIELGLLLVITVTVVTTIPAVGTILSVALLSVPALTARLWSDRVATMLIVSAASGAVCGVVGLVLSVQWRLAAGATIAVTSSGLFGLSWLLRWARRGFRRFPLVYGDADHGALR